MLTPVARQSLTQVRNSSGKLKELGIRLKSIRNIEKITKTMKMISSAKFAKVLCQSNIRYFTNSIIGIENDWSSPCVRRGCPGC